MTVHWNSDGRGDSPGLNAAIRGVGKTAFGYYRMQVIGFRDGFFGAWWTTAPAAGCQQPGRHTTVRNHPGQPAATCRTAWLSEGKVRDMTDVILENYEANHLDALVCLAVAAPEKRAAPYGERSEHHHHAGRRSTMTSP